jgi:hypothetical protein
MRSYEVKECHKGTKEVDKWQLVWRGQKRYPVLNTQNSKRQNEHILRRVKRNGRCARACVCGDVQVTDILLITLHIYGNVCRTKEQI